MNRFATSGSRKRSYFLAAGLGFLYGAIQVVLPPFGELAHSLLLHVVLFTAFVVGLILGRRSLRAAVALSAYLLVLVLAAFLPFKFMDTRVEFDTQEVSIDEVRVALERRGLSVQAASFLPVQNIRLTTVHPSLDQLREALNQQANIDLRPKPVCGNAVSLSFLWGSRVSSPNLYLGILRRSRTEARSEMKGIDQANRSDHRRTPASTGRHRYAAPRG